MIYLAIALCAVAALIIGSVWHSPLMFGKAWMNIMGMKIEDCSPEDMKALQKKMIPTYIAQFILSFIQAFILAYFMVPGSVGLSILASVWLFIGFMLPLIGGASLWSGKPKKLAWQMFGISAGFQLVTIIVYALILSAFI